MDHTTRLGLNKPDPDPATGDYLDVQKLNENADAIDAAISFTVCTSSSRPSSPFPGQAILETDTGQLHIWGGSAWLPIMIGSAEFVGNIGIGSAANANILRKITLYSSGTNGSLSQMLLRQSGAASGSRALSTMGGSDTQDRYWFDFDGKMQWGPGNAGGDVALGRSGAGVLNVEGGLTVGSVRPGAVTEQVITASGTWNKPAGAKQFKVRVVGGGGGGGGAAAATTNASAAGGGGGGGYAEKLFNASDLGATVAVTIGAGGNGGAAGNNNGTAGGTTSFSTVSATGGSGGTGNAQGSAASYAAGGTSGSGSGGDINIDGSDGTNGGRVGGIVTQQGNGGGTQLAGTSRGNGTANGGNGKAGYSYGGGGAGGHDNAGGNTARSGGNGAAGVCIVTAYF